MSALVLYADVVEKGLRLTGVLLRLIGIGGALGITAGVLERKSLEQIQMWGFWGTAIGCLVGLLVTLCVWVILDQS